MCQTSVRGFKYINRLKWHYGSRPLPRVSKALGKTPKHSGKSSPSATLGEGQPEKGLTKKRPSPSAKYRALGEAFPECHAPPRWRFNVVSQIFVYSSPSATFGEEISFFLKPLPRVQHSGKKFIFVLENLIPECPWTGTRGSTVPFF
jgi:hypothetical protein